MQLRRALWLALVTPFLIPPLACGGGSSGHPDAPQADAPIGSGCHVAASYGTASGATADDTVDPGSGSDPGDEELDYTADLDDATGLEITLYSGTADFPGATVGPESAVDLSNADDAQFATCGTCVQIGDNDDTDSEYLATSGHITVTSTTTNFTGTLTGVELTHVTIDDQNHSAPVGDGCTTEISSLAFTATIDTGSDEGEMPHRLRAYVHNRTAR